MSMTDTGATDHDHADHDHADHDHASPENDAGEYVTDDDDATTSELPSGNYVSDTHTKTTVTGSRTEAANSVAPVDHGHGQITEPRESEVEGSYTQAEDDSRH